MKRKNAIALLFAAVTGRVVAQTGKREESGSLFIGTTGPQILQIDLAADKNSLGVGTLRVQYNGQTREISAKEIWEALGS